MLCLLTKLQEQHRPTSDVVFIFEHDNDFWTLKLSQF